MGKRKKSEPQAMPPLKMVIARSPEKKKGTPNQQYAILEKSDPKDIMRSKRRASNINPKKYTEESDDGDDLEVLEVYKPPQSKVPRLGGNQKVVHRPVKVQPGVSLVMECFEEELSPAQKTANRIAQKHFDDVLQRINAMKKRFGNSLKIEHSDVYIGPEETKEIQGPKPPPDQRPASPDLIVLDGEKDTAPPPVPQPSLLKTALRGQAQAKGVARPTPKPPQPVPQQNNKNVIIMPNVEQGLHLAPAHLLPNTTGQSLVLRATSNGRFHVVNNLGQPTMPVVASNGNLLPTLDPRMGTALQRIQPPTTAAQGSKKDTPGAIVKQTVESALEKRGRRNTRKTQQIPLPVTLHGPEEDDSVNWVPLDEYYYSKKEGDPVYREQKGEYRFKCWYCYKMLYNNLRIMMHIQGHIDSEKQQNLDLSDLTQCKHCYKQFDTPFEMQCHVEKVHQNQSNVLVCRICEKDHNTQADLKLHMKVHNTCEMPYICQLCNFRSSVYNDVVDHFKKRHDSSRYLLCLYCLKTFETKFAKNAGWGMTQVYYQHLVKHQTKATNKKCSWCKLAFTNKSDLALHKSKDHLPNYRGILGGSSGRTINANSEQVMIRLPGSQAQGKNKVKSLNAPVMMKQLNLSCLKLNITSKRTKCIECKTSMSSADHYKKYTECSMCRFATTCNEAYASHMSDFHSRGTRNRCRRERPLPKAMFCLCGFSSIYGNKIANHLIFCSKRTCYTEKPEARWFEYDDEQEEFNPFEPYCEEPDSPEVEETSPEKDIPSLFGALGLVKKPPQRNQSRSCSKESSPSRELSPTTVAEEVMEDVLDAIFPAEAEAGQFLDKLVDNVVEESEAAGQKFRSENVILKMRREAERRQSQSSRSESQDSVSAATSRSVDDPDQESKESSSFVSSRSKNPPSATSFSGALDSSKQSSERDTDSPKGDVDSFKENMGLSKEDIPSSGGDVDQAKEEMDATQGNMDWLQDEMVSPKEDGDSLKEDRDSLKDNLDTPMESPKENMDSPKENMDSPKENMDSPKEGIPDNKESLNKECLKKGKESIADNEDSLDTTAVDVPSSNPAPDGLEKSLAQNDIQSVEEDCEMEEPSVEDIPSADQEPVDTASNAEISESPENEPSAMNVGEPFPEAETKEEIATQDQSDTEKQDATGNTEEESAEQEADIAEPMDVEADESCAPEISIASETAVEASEGDTVVEDSSSVLPSIEDSGNKQCNPVESQEDAMEDAPEMDTQSEEVLEDNDQLMNVETALTEASQEVAEAEATPEVPAGDGSPVTSSAITEDSENKMDNEQNKESECPGYEQEPDKDANIAECSQPESNSPNDEHTAQIQPIVDNKVTSEEPKDESPKVVPTSSTSRPSESRWKDGDRGHRDDGNYKSGNHSRDQYSQNRHEGQRYHGHEQGRDRNRDHYHDNRHRHGSSYDHNRYNDRDRYGNQGYNRYDDRHGYNHHKGRHDNRDNRDNYYNRRDNRGGYRGRGGYYGNQGYY